MDGPEAEVFVGVDMAKSEHYAQAVTIGGVEVFGRPVLNDQSDIEAMLDAAAELGPVAVVIDMTASGAQLLLAVAAQRGVPVAYVTGLQMRRAADLYAGTAKTDPRDAWVLADFARRNADPWVPGTRRWAGLGLWEVRRRCRCRSLLLVGRACAGAPGRWLWAPG